MIKTEREAVHIEHTHTDTHVLGFLKTSRPSVHFHGCEYNAICNFHIAEDLSFTVVKL